MSPENTPVPATETLNERMAAVQDRISKALGIAASILPAVDSGAVPAESPCGLTAAINAANGDMIELVSRLEDISARVGRL